MTSRLSWPVRIVAAAALVEVVAGVVLTLRPGACRSTDAVAIYEMPADGCQEAKRIGARCNVEPYRQRDLYEQ